MEDLRQAFEDDCSNMTLHKDNKHRPPRPEKVPLDKDVATIPPDKLKQNSPYAGIDRRHTHDMAREGSNENARHRGFSNSGHQQRPSTSQDDMDVMRRTNKDQKSVETLNLYRQMESLRERVKIETARADQAEKTRDALAEKLKLSFDEVAKGNDSLAGTVEVLQSKTKRLEAELEDARSHIFSLQPYRKDLTPEEVGGDYDDLVNSVSEWAEKFMSPVLDNEAAIQEIVAAARKRPDNRPDSVNKIKRMMQQYGDLVQGSLFPETDIDIAIAIIMRYLHDNIFQKVLYGSIPEYIEPLNRIQKEMHTSVQPKRDLFAIRSWQAEGYNALISAGGFAGERERCTRKLTISLAEIFKIFCEDGKERWNWFCVGFQDNCVKRAMELHEKLIVSTHHFYTDLNSYLVWSPNRDLQTSLEFYDHLEDLECANILQHRKKFNLARLTPAPTPDDLMGCLTNVLTLIPALYMRQIGRGDAIKEPALVRKQKMLVAWGSPEKREKAFNASERTLMNQIFWAKDLKPEHRSTVESWATSWKWS